MKVLRNFAGLGSGTGVWVAAVLLFTGCEGQKPFQDVSNLSGLPPSAVGTAPAAGSPTVAGSSGPVAGSTNRVEVIHVGDLVGITVSSQTGLVIDPFTSRVEATGTITPVVGSIKVAERTVGDVQRELQQRYDRKYRGTTVTVSLGERYYHLLGEITSAGPKPYVGKTDIIQAISSAGGMGVFASDTILLMHPDGKTEELNYKKALRRDPKHNVQVYPGDTIFVKKRWI